MDESDNLAKDILMFLKQVSEEYYLPPDQRALAKRLYDRAGLPQNVAPQTRIESVEFVDVRLNGQTWSLPKRAYEQAVQHLQDGKIIMAIKEVRMATNCGLKEAKDIVELSPMFQQHYNRPRGW